MEGMCRRREVIDDIQMVLDMGHNTGRWAICETKRIEDVNKSVIKELSDGLKMSSKFAHSKALGDLSRSSFSRVVGMNSCHHGSGVKER